MKAGGGVKQDVSLERGVQVSTANQRSSRKHYQAPKHLETQWKYLQTTILTNANEKGGDRGTRGNLPHKYKI